MVSIIVPIYNAEQWIRTCIESALNQNVDFELLLIDDGSTDDSSEICQEYARKFSQVKYFRKENGGVSDSRNYGIKKATGEWITFLDADDYLSGEILEKALQKVDNDSLLIWNSAYIVGNKRTESPDIFANNIKKEDIISSIIYESYGNFFLGYFFRAVWGKVFSRKIILENEIFFNADIYLGEDAQFLLKYIRYVRGIKIINHCGYNYRILETSAVRKYKSDMLEQSQKQLEIITEILLEYKESAVIKAAIQSFMWGAFNSLVLNECKKNKHFVETDDAFTWYRANKQLFRIKNADTRRMSKFLRLELYTSYFVPIRGIAMLAYLYGKRKYIQK